MPHSHWLTQVGALALGAWLVGCAQSDDQNLYGYYDAGTDGTSNVGGHPSGGATGTGGWATGGGSHTGGAAGAKERPFQADIQGLVPLLLFDIGELLATAGIGIVDQDIDAAEPVRERAEHVLDLACCGDVGPKELGVCSQGSDLSQGLLGVFAALEIIDAQIASGLGQGEGDAAPDVASRACDQRLHAS